LRNRGMKIKPVHQRGMNLVVSRAKQKRARQLQRAQS
jgi:hypothetical protein